jgi:acyl-CoA hydrolase
VAVAQGRGGGVATSLADGYAESTHFVQTPDVNALGTIFGGQLCAWIDQVAAVAAFRYTGRVCVTACMDDLDFRLPIRLGDLVVLTALVTWVGRTSLEVEVRVFRESAGGQRDLCNVAHVVFVAVDPEGRPTPVPPGEPLTDEERERWRAAEVRGQIRLRRRRRMAP